MHSINTLPFAQLRNAEHVAFFNNVLRELDKYGAEDLGIAAEKFAQFTKTVSDEQDIVLKAQGSMYTADMEALDQERDNLDRKVRLKLQAVTYSSPDSASATFVTPLEKYILNKYSTDIVSLAYQEEGAHLSGFLLDLESRFTKEELKAMGVDQDLIDLKLANDTFADIYNQRANERAGGTAELTKKLRAESEELYNFMRLHIEYMTNFAAETEKGQACGIVLGVINELVRDARLHLNLRKGKTDGGSEDSSDELDDNVSPIPFPKA